MTYFEQINNKEALSSLREDLNINTLFWMDVRNKNSTNYDASVEMKISEIVNEKFIYHHN